MWVRQGGCPRSAWAGAARGEAPLTDEKPKENGGMRERKAPLCRVEEVDEPAKAGGTAQTSRASGFLATEACTPRGVATHLGKHWLNEPTAITHKAGNSNSESDLSLGARCGQDLSLQQPVVKVRLHSGPPARLPRWGPRSAGDASPLHPNAAAALGTPGWLRCSSLKYCPILPPHRANYARWGPRFSVVRLRSRDTLAAANFGETSPKPWRRRVAPCHRGASPASVRRRDFHHGLLTRLSRPR